LLFAFSALFKQNEKKENYYGGLFVQQQNNQAVMDKYKHINRHPIIAKGKL
jgi:hypothetical protein